MKSEIRFAELAQLRKESVDPRFTPDAPYVGLEHIEPGTLQLTNFGRASDVTSQKLKFYKGDVLFGKLRPYFRKIATAPLDGVCSTDIWVVTGKDTADNEFIKYWMASDTFIRSSTQAAEGSSMPRAQWSWVSEFRTSVVSGAERRSIGRLLGALDDKIALNLQTSQVLEQIAQTIFKSWFIDFDPVHAKSRGEQPEGMGAETAALFPYSFDETELGLIPSGWGVSRFDSFAEIQLGGTPSKAKAEYWDGSIPWINSGAINEFRITKPSRYITELGLRKSSCKVLPKGTTVVAITGATLGQFSRVEIDTTANQSVIGIAPRNRSLNNFVYLWVTQNIEQLTSKATGGAQQHINRNDVCEQLVVLPSHEAFSKFDELVDPIFTIISNLVHQNDTLVEIRDSLLPRLISGELEIPEELLVD